MTFKTSAPYAVGVMWLAIVGVGMLQLLSHEFRPGVMGATPDGWPEDTRVRPDGRPVLIMAAHPLCPCTRASIGELAWIMARTRDRAAVYVLVLAPEPMEQNWYSSDLQKSLAAIPGVRVLIDAGGRESRLFGAATSGATFLYDAHGKLLFHGGITGSRGHSGSNVGRDAVVSLINGHSSDSVSTPVFGCSLTDSHGA